MKRILMLSLMMGLVASLAVTELGAEEKASSPTTKKVMQAIKKGLLKKVLEEMATPKEQQQLLEYVKVLPGNPPPKGDADSWKQKTAELIKATQAVVKGQPKAIERLKQASNCKACHSVHKVYPPKPKKPKPKK